MGSGSYKQYEFVKSADLVIKLFNKERPGGGTNLTDVLREACIPEWMEAQNRNKNVPRRPETILVITDGQPNSKDGVRRVITEATHKYMNTDDDLSISFIQVGDDAAATRYLKELDDDLGGAKFDAVDTITCDQLFGMSIDQMIQMSIDD